MKILSNTKGFTLFETMIVLLVMSFAIGAVMTSLQVYQAEQKEAQIDKTYDSVRSAMNGFISERIGTDLQARYPCPAPLNKGPKNTKFGLEQRNVDGSCDASADGSNGIYEIKDGAGAVIAYIGAVPTNTLKITSEMGLDQYGHKLTYAVSANHVTDFALELAPDAQIEIENEAGIITMAPFALISHGRDAAGAYSIEGGITLACNALTTKDGENCDFSDARFKESRRKLASSSEFYDDHLAFSLVDEDDDEWWAAFHDSPDDIHNKNPGIVCIGADCDHNDALPSDRMVVDGGTSILGSMNVVDFVSAGSDIISGRDLAAKRDVLAQQDISALNNVIAENDILVGNDIIGENALRIGKAAPTGGKVGIDGEVKVKNGAIEVDSDGDGSWGSLYNHDDVEGIVLSAKSHDHKRGDIVIRENGKVGIGTSTPKAQLSVNGEIQIATENTPCTEERAGAIRYISSSKTFEGCDGISYHPLTGQSCAAGTTMAMPGAPLLECLATSETEHAIISSGSCQKSSAASKFSSATGSCVMQCNNGEWKMAFNNCEFKAGFVWVNSQDFYESHEDACARKGYTPAEDQGYGICASGELHPHLGEDMGANADKIEHKYGAWGGMPYGGNVLSWSETAPDPSCISSFSESCPPLPTGKTIHQCFAAGQKRDGDATDYVVAYLCNAD